MGEPLLHSVAIMGRRATLRRAGLRLLALAALMASAAAAPASAEPIVMSFDDAVDQVDPATDLTKGTVSQDPLTGSISAHLEFAGAFRPDAPTAVLIMVGNLAPDGTCVAVKGTEFVTLARSNTTEVGWTVGIKPPRYGYGTATVGASSIDLSLTSDGRLRSHIGTCAGVGAGPSNYGAAYPPDLGFDVVDDVIAKTVLKATTVGGQVASSPTGDRDRDGIADLIDRCPTVAATSGDGCPAGGAAGSAPPTQAQSLRLGARRLVLDRLLVMEPGTAACPSKAKVVVTQRRRLAAVKLPLVAEGTACRIKGVVRLKRYRKRSSLRVVVSAPGIAAVVQTFST